MTEAATFASAVTRWYDGSRRDLPWRRPDATPWAVLVSEFMLQQTPVSRVLPVWEAWLARWPTASALAAEPPGEAVRAWGRLGYPRRALRLHASARVIHDAHDGSVPASYDDLRALPGVGDYTANALLAFAFGRRVAVLDINVRRVYRRVFDGRDDFSAAPTAAERTAALARVPSYDPGRYSVAVMELGALVCTARGPRCGACPVAALCAWRGSGCPAPTSRRRAQAYEGTDRQVRGRLLAVLRERRGAVAGEELEEAWPEAEQRERALTGLLDDGLVEALDGGGYRLPGA